MSLEGDLIISRLMTNRRAKREEKKERIVSEHKLALFDKIAAVFHSRGSAPFYRYSSTDAESMALRYAAEAVDLDYLGYGRNNTKDEIIRSVFKGSLYKHLDRSSSANTNSEIMSAASRNINEIVQTLLASKDFAKLLDKTEFDYTGKTFGLNREPLNFPEWLPEIEPRIEARIAAQEIVDNLPFSIPPSQLKGREDILKLYVISKISAGKQKPPCERNIDLDLLAMYYLSKEEDLGIPDSTLLKVLVPTYHFMKKGFSLTEPERLIGDLFRTKYNNRMTFDDLCDGKTLSGKLAILFLNSAHYGDFIVRNVRKGSRVKLTEHRKSGLGLILDDEGYGHVVENLGGSTIETVSAVLNFHEYVSLNLETTKQERRRIMYYLPYFVREVRDRIDRSLSIRARENQEVFELASKILKETAYHPEKIKRSVQRRTYYEQIKKRKAKQKTKAKGKKSKRGLRQVALARRAAAATV